MPAGHPFPSFDLERFHLLRQNPGVRTLVAEEDGELLGHSTIGTNRDPDAEPGVGEVRSFFVRPSTWRRGVGRALMAVGLADLSERGYSAATLWSFDTNDRANAFYEAQGFTRDGTERREAVWAGLLEVRYRRSLA